MSATPFLYERARTEMIPFVPAHARRILEVGCAGGMFGAALRAERELTSLWGVEPHRALYERNAAYDEVLDGVFPTAVPAGARFDCIVCNDVLEHMEDPWSALRAASTMLLPGGVVVASIPNVRHWSVVKDLVLRGDWTYRDAGILDRTHLRFFTRSTIVALFRDVDMHIERIEPIGMMKSGRLAFVNRLSGKRLDEFLTRQYAVVARAGRA